MCIAKKLVCLLLLSSLSIISDVQSACGERIEQRAKRIAALADSVSLSQIALELLDGKSVEDFSDEQRDIAQEWSEIISNPLVLGSVNGCKEEDKIEMRSRLIVLVAIQSTIRQILVDLGDFKPKTEIEKRLFADFNKPFQMSPSNNKAVSILEIMTAQDPEILAEILRDLDRYMIIQMARNSRLKYDQVLMGASFLQLQMFPQEFISNSSVLNIGSTPELVVRPEGKIK